MKIQINSILILVFTVALFIGCSNKSNPLDPNEPGNGDAETEIRTPKYLKLTNIILSRFPSVKSNGDKWDYNVFPNSPTRRPDIYVELSLTDSKDYMFKSNTKEDAILKTAYDTYSFNKSGSKNGKSLPLDLTFDKAYKLKIIDDDGITSNDVMSEFNVVATHYYNEDNATFLYKTLTSGGYTLKIEGRWGY